MSRWIAIFAAAGISLGAFASLAHADTDPYQIQGRWMLRYPGLLEWVDVDLSGLQQLVSFDDCATSQPIRLRTHNVPDATLQLHSDGCGGTSSFEHMQTLPDGISQIRMEVTCQYYGGDYDVLQVWDGTTGQDGLIAVNHDKDVYEACQEFALGDGNNFLVGYRFVFEP